MIELLDRMNNSISAQEQRDARVLPDNEKNDFETWMHRVDRLLMRVCMLDSKSLPDWTWRDAFDDEATPQEAMNAYFEEYGDGYDLE